MRFYSALFILLFISSPCAYGTLSEKSDGSEEEENAPRIEYRKFIQVMDHFFKKLVEIRNKFGETTQAPTEVRKLFCQPGGAMSWSGFSNKGQLCEVREFSNFINVLCAAYKDNPDDREKYCKKDGGIPLNEIDEIWFGDDIAGLENVEKAFSKVKKYTSEILEKGRKKFVDKKDSGDLVRSFFKNHVDAKKIVENIKKNKGKGIDSHLNHMRHQILLLKSLRSFIESRTDGVPGKEWSKKIQEGVNRWQSESGKLLETIFSRYKDTLFNKFFQKLRASRDEE